MVRSRWAVYAGHTLVPCVPRVSLIGCRIEDAILLPSGCCSLTSVSQVWLLTSFGLNSSELWHKTAASLGHQCDVHLFYGPR